MKNHYQRKIKPIRTAFGLEEVLQMCMGRYRIREIQVEFEGYVYDNFLPASALDHLKKACESLKHAEGEVWAWLEENVYEKEEDGEC